MQSQWPSRLCFICCGPKTCRATPYRFLAFLMLVGTLKRIRIYSARYLRSTSSNRKGRIWVKVKGNPSSRLPVHSVSHLQEVQTGNLYKRSWSIIYTLKEVGTNRSWTKDLRAHRCHPEEISKGWASLLATNWPIMRTTAISFLPWLFFLSH